MNNESFAFYIAMLRKNFVAYCTEKIADLGVTYSQLFVLIYIRKKGNCSSKEIAEYLKIDPGQLNRSLTKLLEKDLVIQRKNSDDRRFNILSLTEGGIRVVEESHKLFYSWDEQVFSDIDESSRQELMSLLKKAVSKLNNQNGGKNKMDKMDKMNKMDKMDKMNKMNKMNKLNDFIKILTGSFNNSEQFERMKKNNVDYPYAEHINTICNGKITNLPEDFKGIFMVEESYYTANGKMHPQPHLFLFTEEEAGIKLTSYELPDGYDKNTFTYNDLKPVDYNDLKLSEKFTPALYTEKDGVWEGGSISMFSPVLKFTLFERFSEEYLEVSESMEVKGKKTFGFDEPIIYKRVMPQ